MNLILFSFFTFFNTVLKSFLPFKTFNILNRTFSILKEVILTSEFISYKNDKKSPFNY